MAIAGKRRKVAQENRFACGKLFLWKLKGANPARQSCGINGIRVTRNIAGSGAVARSIQCVLQPVLDDIPGLKALWALLILIYLIH